MQEAQRLFSNTGIMLTTDGQRHLVATIGTSNFRAQYVAVKVMKWWNKLHRLADFAKTQPHAAYSAFKHDILSQYTFFMGRIPAIHEFIKPVDDVIRLELLPALLNSIVPEADRQLYSLLLRHGGLEIQILPEIAESHFGASQAITLPLATIMITQRKTFPNKAEVNEIKRKITKEQEVRISEQALKVEQDQTPHTLKAIQDAKMPGASSWLGVLPLVEFGFA